MKSIDLLIKELKRQGINAQKIDMRNLSAKCGLSNMKKIQDNERMIVIIYNETLPSENRREYGSILNIQVIKLTFNY